jgi:hypothetical protein
MESFVVADFIFGKAVSVTLTNFKTKLTKRIQHHHALFNPREYDCCSAPFPTE